MRQSTIYLLAAVFTAACFSASAARAAAPSCSLSAPEVSKRIHHEGAKKTIEWLYANNNAEMGKLADCVASGEKAWLDIAATVLKAAPEDGDDELSMALASALDVNAEYVLAVRWPFGLDLICHVSDDVDTYGTSIKNLDFRIRKVEAVKNPSLQSKVHECAESLEANKQWMAHYYQADDDEVPPAPDPGTAPPPPDPGTAPPIPDPPPAPDPGTAPPAPDPGTAPPAPDPGTAPPPPDPGTAPPPPHLFL